MDATLTDANDSIGILEGDRTGYKNPTIPTRSHLDASCTQIYLTAWDTIGVTGPLPQAYHPP